MFGVPVLIYSLAQVTCGCELRPGSGLAVGLVTTGNKVYTVAQKSKQRSFLDIFANYWPIFKIFSLLHSLKNL